MVVLIMESCAINAANTRLEPHDNKEHTREAC